MSFAKDSLSVFSTRIFLLFIGLGTGVILARILGPTNKGILNVVVLIPNLFVSMGHLGIGNANLYFIAKRRAPLQSILSNSLTLTVMLGGGLVLACLVVTAFLRNTLLEDVNLYLIVIAASTIPFTLLTKYASYIFLGKQMIRERNLLNVFQGTFSFICLTLLLLFLRLGIKGALISTLVGLLVAAFYSLNRLGKLGRLSLGFDYKLFRESVGYGIKPYLAMVILSLNYRSDIFLVKYFLTSADVGYYSLSVSIANQLWHLPSSVGVIIYAKIASLNPEQANRLTSKACRNTLFLSFIVGAMLFWLGRFLIPLVYGEAYMPSVGAFMILLPGMTAMTIYAILHSDLAGRGRSEITVYVFSVGLATNIVLNLFLVPRMGIDGAALASTISYTGGSIALGYIFSRLTSTRLREILFIQRSDIQNFGGISSRFVARILGR